MREILFRGKSCYTGSWVEGYFSMEVGEIPYIQWLEYDGYYHEEAVEECAVVLDTVGEYTGLKDKNGKRIFEGDCFKTYCTGLTVYRQIVGYYPEHSAFMARCIEMNTVHYLSDYRPSAIEVIGNIHDNPELLEKENKK